MYTREQLQDILKKVHADKFKAAESKKEKTIENALKNYASGCKREDIVAIYDTTISGNGKKGYLLARDGMYGDNFATFKAYTGGGYKIPFEGMVRFYRLTESPYEETLSKSLLKSLFRFEYEDGTKILAYMGNVYDEYIIPVMKAVLECEQGKKEEPEHRPDVEEARRREEEEARRREEEEARRRAEEEARRRAEEEARRRAEEEVHRRAQEEARRKADEQCWKEEAEKAMQELRKIQAAKREREMEEIFNRGVEACRRKAYEEAVPWFEKAATEFDCTAAMENLGILYLKSNMLGVRLDLAERWYSMALQHGSRQAEGQLEYIRKYNVRKYQLQHRRRPEAMFSLLAQMKFEDAFALWRKGQDLYEENDPEQAFHTMKESLPGRLSQTRFTLGMMYLKGIGCEKDQSQASDLLGALMAGEQVVFGRYPQTEEGEVCEIGWKVLHNDLENKRLLLISEEILDIRPFASYKEEFDRMLNEKWEEGGGIHFDKKQAQEAEAFMRAGKDMLWDKCGLRTWLNNEFFRTAFRAPEAEIISEATIDTAYLTKQGVNGMPADAVRTRDKVFVISAEEFVKYIGDGGKAIRKNSLENTEMVKNLICTNEDAGQYGDPTPYAKKKAGGLAGKDTTVSWWLRTPGIMPGTQMTGICENMVTTVGEYVVLNGVGVRPALWISWK